METKLSNKEKLDMIIQQRNIHFEDDALDAFMPMLHKLVNGRPQNAICNDEDLMSEAVEAALGALLTYDDNEEASLTTHMYRQVDYALKEFHKANYYHLSGGSYAMNIRSKLGPDATIEEMMRHGVSRKTAIATQQFFLEPSEYGAQFNMIDRKQGERLHSIEKTNLGYEQHLTPMECCIVEHIYGLNGEPRMTMEDIGKKINKSRKAVSYALNKALVKLRHVPGIENYIEYL